ncbi:MAG: energy transducer TonB [Archangiaceae bacterium]|nr:energy transducer TonB [Archangiaceae bacterium]
MSAAVALPSRRYDPTKILVVTLLASLGGHVGYVLSLSGNVPHFAENKPIEMEMLTVEPPKPPPPPDPPKEEEKPKPPPPKPVVKVAIPKPKLDELPPPPTEEAPKEDVKPPPIVIGVQLSGTSSAGNFAAPVGNTAMGGVAPKAVAPEEVKAYKAPKYVPPGGADSDPVAEAEVKIPYPEEAKRAGIEGTVRLRITVDFEGHVTEVKVLSGPGYGLDEAAREAIKRFKFKPALKAGEAVSTTITYNYTFLLD